MSVDVRRCIVCGGASSQPLVAIRDVPTLCNRLWNSEVEAISAPRGNIRLAYCPECGHISNTAFDPAQVNYDCRFDSTLSFSPRYRRYAESVAERLIHRYRLIDKTIVEIGCGRGDFLRLLARPGNRCAGYDPSQLTRRTVVGLGSIDIVGRTFAAEDANGADFICCRHVLEHLTEPTELLRQLRKTIGARRDVALLFEVPNSLFILDGLGIWDIIYEHVSYFTSSSLVRAFHDAGFTVLEVNTGFNDQYLWLEAVADDGRQSAAAVPAPECPHDPLYLSFAGRFNEKLTYWRRLVEKMLSDRRRVVVWGAGAKGVMFLNLLRLTRDSGMDRVVDINPRKQGHFVPAMGQKIVAPDCLAQDPPDSVIVMNPAYIGEIASNIEARGISCELLNS
jgi:SAM-dependent methyltransferase